MDQRISTALKDGVTVVTASRRLAHAFRQQYNSSHQANGAVTWQSPAILPWNGWLSALWDGLQFAGSTSPVRLGAWQELVLWERVIRESPASSELLQVGATAATAQEAWHLSVQWRLDLALFDSQGHEDARIFAGWAKRFHKICDGQSSLDTARVPDYLRGVMRQVRLPKRLLLLGFDEFTPQQQDFITACREAGCGIELLNRTSASVATQTVRIPFPDTEQEISAAARWVRGIMEGGNASGIAVVLPDLTARRKQVERVFRTILEPNLQLTGWPEKSRIVNISAGEPLANYPLISSALAILSLSPGANDWKALSAFVRDRHLAGAETERTARGLLDARLRGYGRSQLSIAELRDAVREKSSCCPILDRALAGWLGASEAAPSNQAAGQWCRTFSEMLKAVGWPGEHALNSAEYQTVEAWKGALSELARTDFVVGEMPKGEAFSLLSRIVAGTMYQPESPNAPVQILGTLEASGLQFDHLWIAGLNDETWPGPPSPNPFLPLSLQRNAGVPRCCPERELAFATLVTERLLASSPDIVLSYPTRKDDTELAPSPLILSVPEAAPADLCLWTGNTYKRIIQQSRAMERMVDEQGPPLGADVWQRGGARVFQYQAGCPFRAFAELRLGAEDLENPTPGLDARQRGTLVHATLEAVWKEIRTHDGLCRRNDISKVIQDAAEAAISRLENDRGGQLPPRFALLERQRLERLIAQWLEIEKSRKPFEVVQPEGERYAEMAGIRVKVRIDRIDRLPDDREVIIDYKTGSPNIHSWDTDRPEEPQLPLYSTIHETPLAAVLFAEVKPGEVRFRGLTDGAVVIPGADSTDLAARISEWRGVLERLGTQFRAGHAEVDPKDPAKTCRYCSHSTLCRIAESATYGNEEDGRSK
jgi:probable DNA repair protein